MFSLYHDTMKKLRTFFEQEGFIEVETQSKLSILSACEDPDTLVEYKINGQVYPLPQTGQMHLEHILLSNPDINGVFCQTTSYRDEPNIIKGRHQRIFPMFEFESKGRFQDLINLEHNLLLYFGFADWDSFPYSYFAEKYEVDVLEAKHEEEICKRTGACFITNFPMYTNPFWNMKATPLKNTCNKADVILYGIETIGSAERSCDVEDMKNRFYTINDGKYAEKLFHCFGKQRVESELNNFLNLKMFERFGGGIGVTRLMRALTLKDAYSIIK